MRRHLLRFFCAVTLLGGCSEAAVLVGEVTGPRGSNPPPGGPGLPPEPPPEPPPARDGGASLDQAGSADAPPDLVPPASLLDCQRPSPVAPDLLRARCGICHATAASPVSDYPDLVTPGVRERLLSQRSRACNAKPLVTLINGYVGGHLFDKLMAAQPGCGSQMPFGSIPPLSGPEIECLQVWLRPDDPPQL